MEFESVMKWIGPLFTNAGGWAAFVAWHNGVWYVDRENPIVIGEGNSGTLLLPIMQKGYGENIQYQTMLLKEGLVSNDQDPDLAESFPFHVPVLTAFQNMQGWTRIAADWVQYLDLNMERSQILFDACQSKSIDQSTRHKVLKVVKNWAKHNGFEFIRP